MLEITHNNLFAEVVEAAKHRTLGDERWIHAIDRAAREIADNPMLHWQGTSLLIQSSTSSEVYEANGSCQCPAFGFHNACWHRAAFKLWKRYLEALARPARSEDAAVLVSPAARKVERVRGFQI